MQIFGLVVGTLMFSFAQAQETRFQVLQGLYEKGESPNFEGFMDKKGSGRCFLSSHPNLPVPSFLSARKVDVFAGPLFPNELQIRTAYWTGRVPSYFDSWSLEKIEAEGYAPYTVQVMSLEPRTLGFREPNQSVSFRRAENRLIAMWNNASLGLAYCYYWVSE